MLKEGLKTNPSKEVGNFWSLHRVLYQIYPFLPRAIQCYNCFRWGHLDKNCKNSIRCSKCGESHKSIECSSKILFCVHCKGEHTIGYDQYLEDIMTVRI